MANQVEHFEGSHMPVESRRIGWNAAVGIGVIVWVLVMIVTAGDVLGATAIAAAILGAYALWRLYTRGTR